MRASVRSTPVSAPITDVVVAHRSVERDPQRRTPGVLPCPDRQRRSAGRERQAHGGQEPGGERPTRGENGEAGAEDHRRDERRLRGRPRETADGASEQREDGECGGHLHAAGDSKKRDDAVRWDVEWAWSDRSA